MYGSSSGGHVAELLAMRPRDPRYNAIPLRADARGVDATVAYVAMRSPISDPYARFQHAEKMKREAMMKNHTTFFKPWETIHEGNPQEILERHEPVTLVPLLIMQGALDDNVLPARAGEVRRDLQGRRRRVPVSSCSRAASTSGSPTPGPQTDRAREMVKDWIKKYCG